MKIFDEQIEKLKRSESEAETKDIQNIEQLVGLDYETMMFLSDNSLSLELAKGNRMRVRIVRHPTKGDMWFFYVKGWSTKRLLTCLEQMHKEEKVKAGQKS